MGAAGRGRQKVHEERKGGMLLSQRERGGGGGADLGSLGDVGVLPGVPARDGAPGEDLAVLLHDLALRHDHAGFTHLYRRCISSSPSEDVAVLLRDLAQQICWSRSRAVPAHWAHD